MRIPTLTRIACPVAGCWSPLQLADPPYPAPQSSGGEVTEGVLVCTGCGAEYPILAGVALLETDLTSYLAAFWNDIDASVASAGAGVSAEMRRWLGLAESFTGHPGPASPVDEYDWSTAPYLQAHFDPGSWTADLPDGWWRDALEDFRSRAGDPYDLLLATLVERASRTGSSGLAVEVGSGPGRGSAALAAAFEFSLGIDRSFRSILAGRRYFLGAPTPLTEYLVRSERSATDRRRLAPGTGAENLDFVVGSATALPLPRGAAAGLAAVNVLCAVPDPMGALAEFARTTAAGALLLMATPFWSDEESSLGPAIEDPQGLRQALAGWFRIEQEAPLAPWIVRLAKRRWNVYLSYCVVAARLNSPDGPLS